MRAKEKKEINIVVGENIKFYREQAGYTREKLAELIGITPRFLADAEHGYVGVSLTNLKRICEILGISSDRLIWRKREKIDLSEKIAHIDKQYLEVLEQLIQKQLEIIAIATKEEVNKKTRN